MLVWLNKMVLPPSFVHLMSRLAKGAKTKHNTYDIDWLLSCLFHMFHFLSCLALHVIVMIFSPFFPFHLTLSSALPHYVLGKQHHHFFPLNFIIIIIKF
jgi:hypothetical protein